MSPNELAEHTLGIKRRIDLKGAQRPPLRGAFSMMEADPAELPRIAKDPRTRLLVKHEMIVFFRFKPARLDPQMSTHAEMYPKPVVVRKEKEHLLAARDRA